MTDAPQSRNLLTRNPLRGRFLRDGDPATEPASILSLPNLISIVRILFIPAMLWLLIADAVVGICIQTFPPQCMTIFPAPQDGPLRWIAAALFIVAIATDWIDGRIARSRRLVTDFGIFLDPVADKGLTGAALVGLAIIGELWWWVVAIILVREIGITIWRAVALKDRVIAAGYLGKLKTAVQGVAIGAWLLPLPRYLGDWFWWVDWVLMGAALVLTVWSGVDYLVKGVRVKPSSAPSAPIG